MSNYPDAVEKIANDYLERVKSQLRFVPAREQEEFLREIQSHLYEAYRQTPAEDDVARILAVLRNLGEPGEVVSERLPTAMVRYGAKRNFPLQVIGGILIALFGIPLGFGGVAVLAGILTTLAGTVAVYYLSMGIVFLVGALLAFLGLTRIYEPEFWDKLIALGVVQMDPQLAQFLNPLSPSGQGFLMIVLAGVFVAIGLGMLWLGKHLVRGLGFLLNLILDGLRKFAQTIRRRLHHDKSEVLHSSAPCL